MLLPNRFNNYGLTFMAAVTRVRCCWRCRRCLIGVVVYTDNTVYTVYGTQSADFTVEISPYATMNVHLPIRPDCHHSAGASLSLLLVGILVFVEAVRTLRLVQRALTHLGLLFTPNFSRMLQSVVPHRAEGHIVLGAYNHSKRLHAL